MHLINCLQEARSIVRRYNGSVAVLFYNCDFDQTEEQHQINCTDLYDEYVSRLSAAIQRAPMLSEVEYDGHEQAVLTPCREIGRNELAQWRGRYRFFIRGVNDLVITALCAALSRM